MAKTVINEVHASMGSAQRPKADALLDMHGMQTLLTESNSAMKTFGFDMEQPDAMKALFNDNDSSGVYIDSLSEGLDGEDAVSFRAMARNTLDCITGRGSFANRGIMNLLSEDNVSAGFMPVAKLIFPMLRFTWPRLHVKEICTVVPMDSPEIVRYFFKAFAKAADNTIIPLPSYSPLGNGQAIGTVTKPKEVATPSTVNLLDDIGASNTNTHISKNAMIVGFEGVDPNGDTFTEEDCRQAIVLTIDADGKFELHVDCDPKQTQANAVVDVVSGVVDFEKGYVAVSNTRSAETNGKVTKIKLVCSASSSEHNISPKIVLDGKQIKMQAHDVQLSSEWSQQYAFDSATRSDLN